MCDILGSRLQSLPRGNVDPERRASLTDGLDPALEAEQQVGVLVNSYSASLQELMMQLLVHWRVSAAVCAAVGECGSQCTGGWAQLHVSWRVGVATSDVCHCHWLVRCCAVCVFHRNAVRVVCDAEEQMAQLPVGELQL